MIAQAPYPSHNRPDGRRPHAHRDREDLFAAERAGLTPLPAVAPPARGAAPVLWSYPACELDYARQNRRGEVAGQTPGPHRIITDRHKNIQGMVTHYPFGDHENFARVPERERYTRRL